MTYTMVSRDNTMLDCEEIYALWKERQRDLSPYHATAAVLQSVYNGEMEVTLPELDANEITTAANLVQTGLDQHAMRISSVMPMILAPSIRPSNTSRKRADQRKLTYEAWWYVNNITMKMPRRARYLAGLASSPVLVYPGPDSYPVWDVWHPLESFPAPCDPDQIVPPDCIRAYERTAKWVKDRYPEFGLTIGKNLKPNDKVKLLQYIGPNQLALIACGKKGAYDADPSTLTLATTVNRTGRPLVAVPGRITLDKLLGQFDQLVGMYATQAKLWALQIHAVMREVFGETWAQANSQGGTPDIKVEANPYDGTVGIVSDGTIQQFRVQSSQGPNIAIDRLERTQRVTGAIPAEFGGEGGSNLRTGRRGEQVMSATVDFYVAEHQNLLAASLQEENKIAVAIAKAYWGDTPKTFYIPMAKGQVSYTPNVTFETDSHSVVYAYAGSDSNTLVVGAGQRIAQKTLSKKSFMLIDPMVSDVDAEHDFIMAESLEDAMLMSIVQQAQAPDGPWSAEQLARLIELVDTQDKELWEAVRIVHQEAASAQQQQQQPGSMPQQPGLAMAGAPGTPQAGVPIQPPSAGQMDLSSILANLRNPQRHVDIRPPQSNVGG